MTSNFRREFEPFEKVNASHPDKAADRIAGALVDYVYCVNKNAKCAFEVLAGHRLVTVIGESGVIVPEEFVRAICERILKDDGFVLHYICVPQDVELAKNQAAEVRCGDNGIFKGEPTTETQHLLARISRYIYDVYGTDGKYVIQQTEPDVYSLIICQSYATNEQLEQNVREMEELFGVKLNATINPLGPWTGGIDVDSGATNRKLGSDMADSATGGGLMGKDLSKADVSVNIYCYAKAQELGKTVRAKCAIGDLRVAIETEDNIEFVLYKDIVAFAENYIKTIGGYEKFAEEGLVR